MKVDGDAGAPYYVPKGVDGQPAVFLKAKPKTNPDKCSGCGECARTVERCVVSAEDPAQVIGICIKCQACIRGCKAKAKYFDDPAFLSHLAMLEKNFVRHAENRVYL